MGNGVGFTDIGQELVAQALTFGGTGNEPGDVHELHSGGYFALRFDDLRDALLPRVGYRYHAGIGFDGAEREVLGIDAGPCQGVEKGRFAHVGQADNATFETHV